MNKDMMITALKCVFTGVSIACIIVVAVQGIIGAAAGGPAGEAFVRQAVAALLTGLGFGLPSTLFYMDRVALWAKWLAVYGVGLTVMFLAGSWAGWLPQQQGVGAVVGTALIMVAFSVVIGIISNAAFKKDVAAMNKRLAERRRQRA